MIILLTLRKEGGAGIVTRGFFDLGALSSTFLLLHAAHSINYTSHQLYALSLGQLLCNRPEPNL